jgi:hypothetical protein
MLDELTRREIDKVTERILRDAGLASPPIRVETLLEHLRVHRHFFDLQDPNLLQRFSHKVKVQKQKLIRIVEKIHLAAVWLPDEERILVDHSQPAPKQEWASFHDVTHRILEWHRPYFLGDTATTLDPAYQEDLEEEANFGASALMFCGTRFTREALDTSPDWQGVQLLKQRYGKSWQTTLRRFVEHGPERAMAMIVSTPWWVVKPDDQPERCRHFVVSRRFMQQFSGVPKEELLQEIDRNTSKRRGGPVGDFDFALEDDNGALHEFHAESFFNSHYLLTLIVHRKNLTRQRLLP